jgi:hypothetical protein
MNIGGVEYCSSMQTARIAMLSIRPNSRRSWPFGLGIVLLPFVWLIGCYCYGEYAPGSVTFGFWHVSSFYTFIGAAVGVLAYLFIVRGELLPRLVLGMWLVPGLMLIGLMVGIQSTCGDEDTIGQPAPIELSDTCG